MHACEAAVWSFHMLRSQQKYHYYTDCMYFRLDSNGDVKVGDFGLAEDVYSTGYFRQSDSERVKLPYKWLALESLNDAIFNEKTDVVRTINALNSFLMIIIEIKNATLYHALDCGLWTIKTELFA